MNLADKLIHPLSLVEVGGIINDNLDYDTSRETAGITYKEALVLALAGNPEYVYRLNREPEDNDKSTAIRLIKQADAIIKEMEK